MKRLLLLSFFAICFLNLVAQKSHIQVVADPGISMYIDGVFKGVTNAEFGGLIIQDLEPGNHRIEARKEGFRTQSDNISLSPGQVLTYNLDDFLENISISEKGEEDEDLIERNVGNLKIQSLPVEISIRISGLNINYQKRKDSWTAENVPSGQFEASFNWNSKTLTNSIQIEPGMESHYMVNMVNEEFSLLGITPISRANGEVNKGNIKTEGGGENMKSPISHTLLLVGAVPLAFGFKYAVKKNFGGYFGLRGYRNWFPADQYSETPIVVTIGLVYKMNQYIIPYLGLGIENTYSTEGSFDQHRHIRYGAGELGVILNVGRISFDLGSTLGEGIFYLNYGIGINF